MYLLSKPTYPTAQEQADKAAILELIQFERFCRDNALWQQMKECFTEDSTVEISWFEGSGYDFIKASEKMTSYAPHKIFNTQTWIKGDRAISIMVTTIEAIMTVEGVSCRLESDAKLVFQTVKKDGEWYINRFEGFYDKDAIIPVVPTPNFSIPKEELNKYRSSYACLSYFLEKSGYTVSQDLVGRDRPESVEKRYIELNNWLMGGK